MLIADVCQMCGTREEPCCYFMVNKDSIAKNYQDISDLDPAIKLVYTCTECCYGSLPANWTIRKIKGLIHDGLRVRDGL